jgi:methylmalonyl-CoA/ethylmalonyl-CoA epimerase
LLEGVSHVGIVVSDIDAALSFWVDKIGYREVERMQIEVEGVRSVFVSPGHKRGEGMVIELIEPIDKSDMGNAISRRLAETGPGIFHIAMFAEQPASESVRLQAAGIEVIDLPPAEKGAGPRAVVHPKSADGVLIEILPRH